ncbi:MAG: hypothetical protein JSR27_11030 [Proteobacteria bacterium]|nr:hypothetical protein [Pseudomonadota bacterium]
MLLRRLPIVLALCAPLRLWACACGCGVFEVGGSAMLPQGAGTQLIYQMSYLDQTDNWSGTARAPAADNEDQHIRTLYQSIGLRHLFDRAWGFSVEVPYDQRHFSSVDDDLPVATDHAAIGDIRIMGLYTGFSGDMSSGLDFGLKLANGDWKHPGFDRDTQIGSGSTDALLGGYRQFRFGDLAASWSGFVQALVDVPLATQGGYRPGTEFNAVFGAYPDSWRFASGVELTPMLQALGSLRRPDGGVNGDADNTGYARLLAAPGLELRLRRLRVFADIEAPLWQNVRGNQLIAPWQARMTVSLRL